MLNSHHKCNRCGECCSQEVCEYGVASYGTKEALCPGYKIKDSEGYCELVKITDSLEEHLKVFFLFRLGVGIGCCNDFKEWAEV